MNSILNSKKSISSETLSVIQQKFVDKSLLKRTKSIGFFTEEIHFKANQKKEQFLGVLNRFFENYPKNLLDKSINWLKEKFEKKSLAKLVPLNDTFLKNFNTRFSINDNRRKRKGSESQLKSPKASVFKNKRGRKSIFDQNEQFFLFESFSNNNKPDINEIQRLFELFGSKFSEQQIINWFNNMRKKRASVSTKKKNDNFKAIEENLEEEMPSESENQVDREIEDGGIQDTESEIEEGEIPESDSELEDGEIRESESEIEDGEIHDSDKDLGEIRKDHFSVLAFKHTRYEKQYVNKDRDFAKIPTEEELIISESNLTANQNEFKNEGELEEGEIRDEISKREMFYEQQKKSQDEDKLDYEDQIMVGIIEEQRYPCEFLFNDNYGYDDSILNTNLIGYGQSIISDENILEINAMVDRLKYDHFEEIQNYINKINELELKVQTLQDSNKNKQNLIKEISVDFDLVNSECENFEKASKLKDDKLIDLEKAYQDIYTAYDKLLVQNDVLLKEKNDLTDRIFKLEKYISEFKNINKAEIPQLKENSGSLNKNDFHVKKLEESLIALTNELQISYEANEQISSNYEDKIKNLKEEFEKRRICDKENFSNELDRVKKDQNENIEILNKQIESKNSDFSVLVVEKNEEIEKLISKAKYLEESNEKKVKDLNNQKTQLKKNCSSEIKKLDAQKTRLQDEIDKLKNDNKNLENNFLKLNEENIKNLSNITKFEELIQVNEKIVSNEKEILEQRIVNIINKTEIEKTKLQNEIDALKKNETEFNEKVNTLETENKTQGDKIQKLSQELIEAKSSTNHREDYQNYIPKEEHEKLKAKNKKLKIDMNKLIEEKATIENNNQKFLMLVDENKEFSNKAEIEITKLQNDIKVLKEQHLENLSSEIERKESEFNEKLKTLETENKTQSEKLEQISKQLDEAAKNSVNLENYISIEEIEKYKNTINSLENTLQKLTDEKDLIEDENKKSQEEKTVLSEEINNLKKQNDLEMDELWQKNSDQKIDHKEELNNLVSQYEKTIKDLKDEKNQIEIKYSTLLPVEKIEIISNNTSSCPIKNCDGSGNINPKHNTHKSIINCPKNPKNAETKKIINELQKQNTELQNKIENMKIAAQTNEKFAIAVDNVFKEENSELKDKNRKLKEKKKKYKSANQDLNIQIEKLTDEINNLREEFEKKNCEIVYLKTRKEDRSRPPVDSRFNAIEKARSKIENRANVGNNISVGSYSSTGPKNGRTVYLGPSEGLFTFNPGKTKSYISNLELENIILDE